MSIAAGLTFTGCGNSGSTGSTFEPVPLIDESNEGVAVLAHTPDVDISITLYQDKDRKSSLRIYDKNNDRKRDEFSVGSWIAEQSPTSNNTYQIRLFDITADGCECNLTCKDFILTIPEVKLQDYRKGLLVGATLYVDFTHTPASAPPSDPSSLSPCKLPSVTGAIQGTMAAEIIQAPMLED